MMSICSTVLAIVDLHVIKIANLFKALVELIKNAFLIEHFPLIAMSVVVGYPLTKISRKLTINHVFLNLLELHTQQGIFAATN